MVSVFSKIVAGELPAYRIYEDKYVLAFLDIRPRTLGQSLIVPKVEVDHFFDLDEEYSTALFLASQKISKALKQATDAERIWMSIEGFEVAHVHVKLIACASSKDVNLDQRHECSEEEMDEIHQKILSHIEI